MPIFNSLNNSEEKGIFTFQYDASSATTFDPSLTSTKSIRWDIGDGSLPVASNSISVNPLIDGAKNVKVWVDKLENITTLNTYLDGISGVFDISLLTNLTSIFFPDNPDLTSVINPTNNQTITSYRISDCGISTLDVSSFSNLGGFFQVISTPSLTGITNPTSSGTIFSQYHVNSNNLSTLDVSGLEISELKVNTNPLLTSFSLKDGSTMTSLYAHDCSLTGTLDISGQSGLTYLNVGVQTGNLLTTISNPTSSALWTTYAVTNMGLTDTLNVSTLSNLGGILDCDSNSLTGLTLPTNSIRIDVRCANNSIVSLDVSMMTGCYAVRTHSMSTLTSIVLPATTEVFTSINAYHSTSLKYVDVSPILSVSDGIDIRMYGNSMSTTEVNRMLVEVDATTWINGVLYLHETNSAPDGTSGGFNGTGSTANLITKGWTVLTT